MEPEILEMNADQIINAISVLTPFTCNEPAGDEGLKSLAIEKIKELISKL